MKLTREQRINGIYKLDYIRRNAGSSVSTKVRTERYAEMIRQGEVPEEHVGEIADFITEKTQNARPNSFNTIAYKAFDFILTTIMETPEVSASATKEETETKEIDKIKIKIDELYNCTSQSGAVLRIRNLRNRLYDLPRNDEVDELIDIVDKEAEFWMPYA